MCVKYITQHRNSFSILLCLIATFFFSPNASADSSCDFYKKNLPILYDAYCKGGGHGKTRPAGANSSFSSSFNISPARLPSEPSPYGLETIGSYIRTDRGLWQPTFSLIKGFHKFGTGASTAGSNTFYGNDVVQRSKRGPLLTSFKAPEESAGLISNFNVGTSFALLRNKKQTRSLNLGISVRYNKTTNSVGGGPALLASLGLFSFGAGVTRERVSKDLAPIYFLSATASVRVLFLEFEYNILKNAGGPNLQPIHIGTITANFGRLFLTAAARRLNYHHEAKEVTQPHFAAQVMLSKRLSLGFLYNYIPGANSIATQIYL